MGKRARVTTPQKEKTGKLAESLTNLSVLTAGQVGKLQGFVKSLQGAPKAADLAGVMRELLGSLLSYFQDQSTLVSDALLEVSNLEERVEEIEEKQEEEIEKVASLERNRVSKIQVDSRKDMTEKVKISAKQFKLFDIDFKKEVSDRKELLATAKAEVRDRISESRRAKYEELVKKATVQVLAKATMKRKIQGSDSEVWTAPILFTVDDRETRWELEDTLRSNGLYPTFHWDRDILDSVKEMRTNLKGTYPEDKFMIRIRPEERAGNWQIKADIKPRDGNERFKLGATWAIPPLDPAVRGQVEDWAKPKLAQKPTWAKIVVGDTSSAGTAAGHLASGVPGTMESE